MNGYNEEGQSPSPWLRIDIVHRLHGPAGGFDLVADLAISRGAFVVLAGPSGAGKTTLLRILAGFQRPDRGRVLVDRVTWTDSGRRTQMAVHRRPIGFVFQDYALFPNMTVRGNLDYALGRHAARGEAERLLALAELGNLSRCYPATLSGGQKQRLALIRALARRPQLLMLDEPLSALDPDLRQQLQDELLRLHRAFGTTTLMVSHDPLEIARLADRVIRLENGRVVADGPVRRDQGLRAQHVSGPDAEGWCEALVNGHLCRLRYAVPPGGLAPGTMVGLDALSAAPL